MRRIFVLLAIVFSACASNYSAEEKSNLSSIDSNTANSSVLAPSDQILIQPFTQLPAIVSQCRALFVQDTSNTAAPEYYFVSNLKGVAFIKLNNRLMELKLVKQTNFDKYTVNELYLNDEVEVDLKIRQSEEENATWNYKGVLVIKRDGKTESISIAGKLGC